LKDHERKAHTGSDAGCFLQLTKVENVSCIDDMKVEPLEIESDPLEIKSEPLEIKSEPLQDIYSL